jgi:23S rRNA (cytosine1962-C5)-methyltransferase
MKIILKPHRDESLRRRHPWVFSGAIASVTGTPAVGETIEIFTAEGEWLARGSWSPHSQIRARVWTFQQDEEIDQAFFRGRISRAAAMRSEIFRDQNITAFRLINSESDGLPGVIVDRYGDFLVCQFLSTGAEFWKNTIVTTLQELGEWRGIYERSDAKSRQQEGLPLRSGLLWGEEPPPLISVREQDIAFFVDVRNGHKTGSYLDQRENRVALAAFCQDAELLNCFSYSGGFSLWALHGEARNVVNIDTSQVALDLCLRNMELNDFTESQAENIHGDVFHLLRQFRDQNRQFDIVVLDPPKFAESAAQVLRASRGYKDINMLAMQVLRPGGILFTFSCSGHLVQPLFQKIVADAALDAGREALMIRHLSQAADHPVLLSFPEGSYLKGLVCRID